MSESGAEGKVTGAGADFGWGRNSITLSWYHDGRQDVIHVPSSAITFGVLPSGEHYFSIDPEKLPPELAALFKEVMSQKDMPSTGYKPIET
jgi:hypothetical protein